MVLFFNRKIVLYALLFGGKSCIISPVSKGKRLASFASRTLTSQNCASADLDRIKEGDMQEIVVLSTMRFADELLESCAPYRLGSW